MVLCKLSKHSSWMARPFLPSWTTFTSCCTWTQASVPSGVPSVTRPRGSWGSPNSNPDRVTALAGGPGCRGSSPAAFRALVVERLKRTRACSHRAISTSSYNWRTGSAPTPPQTCGPACSSGAEPRANQLLRVLPFTLSEKHAANQGRPLERALARVC